MHVLTVGFYRHVTREGGVTVGIEYFHKGDILDGLPNAAIQRLVRAGAARYEEDPSSEQPEEVTVTAEPEPVAEAPATEPKGQGK